MPPFPHFWSLPKRPTVSLAHSYKLPKISNKNCLIILCPLHIKSYISLKKKISSVHITFRANSFFLWWPWQVSPQWQWSGHSPWIVLAVGNWLHFHWSACWASFASYCSSHPHWVIVFARTIAFDNLTQKYREVLLTWAECGAAALQEKTEKMGALQIRGEKVEGD